MALTQGSDFWHKFVFDRVENIIEKAENAGYQKDFFLHGTENSGLWDGLK